MIDKQFVATKPLGQPFHFIEFEQAKNATTSTSLFKPHLKPSMKGTKGALNIFSQLAQGLKKTLAGRSEKGTLHYVHIEVLSSTNFYDTIPTQASIEAAVVYI
uniref:Uncharacterized protein n=1 Tax=Glossina pallidipes TaxID=7398 RepID=A0A1A9ZMP3_GLOPL